MEARGGARLSPGTFPNHPHALLPTHISLQTVTRFCLARHLWTSLYLPTFRTTQLRFDTPLFPSWHYCDHGLYVFATKARGLTAIVELRRYNRSKTPKLRRYKRFRRYRRVVISDFFACIVIAGQILVIVPSLYPVRRYNRCHYKRFLLYILWFVL